MNFSDTFPIMRFFNSFAYAPAVILIIIGIIFAAFTTILAEQKGYPLIVWVIIGFLFGPIALVAAAGLPDRKLNESIQMLIQINKNNDDFECEDARQKKRNIKFTNHFFSKNKSAREIKEELTEIRQDPEE